MRAQSVLYNGVSHILGLKLKAGLRAQLNGLMEFVQRDISITKTAFDDSLSASAMILTSLEKVSNITDILI